LKENRGKITMTEYGEKSYTLLPGTKIGSIELTEEIQQDMRDIAAEKVNPDDLLSKMRDYIRHDLKVMSENGSKIEKFSLNNDIYGQCPKCGSDVREVPQINGFSCEKGKDKCGFVIWKTIAKKAITSEMAIQLLEHGKTDKIKGFKGKKGDFEAMLVVKSDFTIGFEF
jgi:DNA topoisomerase-3